MLSLATLRMHKHRSTKFVPVWSAGVAGISGGLLEARALTAPAFYRQPPNSPVLIGAPDYVLADGNVNSNTATDLYSVQFPAQLINNPNSPQTITASVFTTVTAVDLANPPSPSSSVGTPEVNFTQNTKVSVTVSDPNAIAVGANAINIQNRVRKPYVLADDSTSNGPSKSVVETFSYHYARPAVNQNAPSSGIPRYAYNFTSGSAVWGFTHTVNIPNMPPLAIGGVASPVADGSPHTVTTGNSTMTYTLINDAQAGVVDFKATMTTNVGVLPLTQRDGADRQLGVWWQVASDMDMTLNAQGAGEATVTTDYSAKFTP